MRLLTTLKSESDAKKVADILARAGIENQVDGKIDTDWGSDNYGSLEYTIWVVDEDQTEKAATLLAAYQVNPSDSSYPPLPPSPPSKMAVKPKSTIKAPITFYLIVICSLLFGWESIIYPNPSLIYTSPIKKDLLYDFPEAYELLGKLVDQYGIDALKNPGSLPTKGLALVQKVNRHPYWEGYYNEALAYFNGGTISIAPWFEKIKEGEVWRLFTPIFLHGDIFHLLFNMIWLYVLGSQLELHLKPFRYLLFIVLAAAFTNTAQYLMGGPNFLGISGVICAMLTFIWKRQNDAPWEGYQLQHSTFIFMMIFIFGMLALQVLSFILEVITHTTLSTSIANTAHILGALFGLILAHISYFTRDKTA